MAEYIDREALIKAVQKERITVVSTESPFDVIKRQGEVLKNVVETFPAADVSPVVRCRDCTEWDKKECECSHWYGFRENDYCSHGARREEYDDEAKPSTI